MKAALYEQLVNGSLKSFPLPVIFPIWSQGYKTLDTLIMLYLQREEVISLYMYKYNVTDLLKNNNYPLAF